jgi:hypothetical protein
MICTRARCSAFGYGDVAEDILGGALFEDECPNEQRHLARPRREPGQHDILTQRDEQRL